MIDLPGSLEDQRAGQRRDTDHGPMCKTISDLTRYVDVLRTARPQILLETGTWTGASAHWFGSQIVRVGGGPALVITIDTQPTPDLLVTFDGPGYVLCPLVGSSIDPHVVALTKKIVESAGDVRVMVVLDSDHSAAHVLAELDAYAELVTPGQYLVVEDTITRHMPNQAGYDGSPADAVDTWLPAHPAFVVDEEIEDLLPRTQHPGGWLRRVS